MIGLFTTSCRERPLPFVGNETRTRLPEYPVFRFKELREPYSVTLAGPGFSLK